MRDKRNLLTVEEFMENFYKEQERRSKEDVSIETNNNENDVVDSSTSKTNTNQKEYKKISDYAYSETIIKNGKKLVSFYFDTINFQDFQL